MIYTIKHFGISLISILLWQSCIVNPEPDYCEIVTLEVTKIYEAGTKDIVIDNSDNNNYYINRGLESGYDIASMKEDLLNKKVTLHLAKTIFGKSNHIAQLAVNDSIYYTEFK